MNLNAEARIVQVWKAFAFSLEDCAIRIREVLAAEHLTSQTKQHELELLLSEVKARNGHLSHELYIAQNVEQAERFCNALSP